ncbi:hypothetical protein [Leucobacter sp. wl10]|uniref:hypothetical protein n=1 Tax=Leucobacter sp. wl10 TaxID=2304677 RepID=UPI000E5B05B2|nr:hypothetical protein [Leucobacter sp. wl10]RGE21572.1 hypothetical protein D1J51_07020 [Leucobacter sp. wl10]
MDERITRIHPDFPVCWEDPETLRIGFERPLARLRTPSPGAQRLIGRLLTGFDPGRLPREAQLAGITPREARGVLRALDGALVTAVVAERSSPPPRLLRTLLSDDGREPPGLRDALIATGLCTFDGIACDGGSGTGWAPAHDLVIYVERFLEPLERAQRWLIEGVPHLLARFTDGAVQVGPLVGDRGRPCHSCITLAFLAGDAAYPVLAAQLSGRTPRSETVAAAHMVAAFAAVLIREWLSGDPAAHAKRIVIPVARGLVAGAPRVESVAPHPECACAL